MDLDPGITPLVESWLPQQRWFGGKGREIASMSVQAIGRLDETVVWVATVTYADGDVEVYQVPLVFHEHAVDSLEHVLLGTIGGAEAGLRWIYDALHDKDVTAAWLTHLRDEADDGRLRFVRVAGPDDIPVDTPSLAMSAEQSNTSLMYGDIAILKVFRRLQPGLNPDVEVQGALTELGATHVPRLLGHVTGTVDGDVTSLAMLQEFMTTASDGWDLAKASVRDLMAEADLHAEEAGGDFAAEAERLGTSVAEVHRDLRKAFGVSRMGVDDWRKRVDTMRDKLSDALTVVPALAEVADGLRALYEQAAGSVPDEGLEVQRIHGDLHLGQVLRTVHRWVLIDFEGEPMATMAARREHDSVLRDIAGMLRSFDYAGHHRVIEAPGSTPQLAYRADEWSQRNRGAFCSGYAESAGADPRGVSAVLRAFEAEKAVYEAVYEARNRPSWLAIPLASLHALSDPGEDR